MLVFVGTNLDDPDNGIRSNNKEVDVAYSRYEEKINDIVRWVAFKQKKLYHIIRTLDSSKAFTLFLGFDFRRLDDLESLYYVRPSVCLSACLSVCPSVCLSVCLHVCLHVCLSICLSDCLSHLQTAVQSKKLSLVPRTSYASDSSCLFRAKV